MTLGLLLVASYLLGSVPTRHLAARWAGVDPRERGTGRPDVTDVFGILGWRAALAVVAADTVKGFVPVWIFPSWDGRAESWLALAFGLCVIAGDVRSVFVRIEGGKGVATTGGVLMALTPLSVGVGLLVWVGITALTRIVPVASLAAASVVPVIAWIADAPAETVVFTIVLALLVWWAHRGDVGRLLGGREMPHGYDRSAGETAGSDRSTGREGG